MLKQSVIAEMFHLQLSKQSVFAKQNQNLFQS